VSYTDYRKEARGYSARAGAHTRRGERWARQAASLYASAAEWAVSTIWLAGKPWAWDSDYNPAAMEGAARDRAASADIFLRMSFKEDERAAYYRGLAAKWREMAARQEARLSASSGQGRRGAGTTAAATG
jgi:hypothetical protein